MGRISILLLLGGCAFDPAGLPGVPGTSGDAQVIDASPPEDAAIDASEIVPDAAPAACPAAYVDGYRVAAAGAAWEVAVADCADELPGATYLVIVDGDTENAQVDTLGGAGDVWLGASDRDDEGTWVDVLGGSVSFQPWGFLEPNNGGLFGDEEDCAEMNNGGVWNDQGCGTSQGYVCECDLAGP